MPQEFKLVTADDSKGKWIDEEDLLKLIKLSYNRNNYIYNKLVDAYEHLTGLKFKKEWIRKQKRN